MKLKNIIIKILIIIAILILTFITIGIISVKYILGKYFPKENNVHNTNQSISNEPELMAKNISEFAQSDYGIGITGKINRKDENNLFGDDNKIFYSIYDKENDKFYDYTLVAIDDTRFNNKVMIKNEIAESLLNVLTCYEEC